MPELTAKNPHVITCIKDSIFMLLAKSCGDDITVSCDRDDCWDDRELFKHRQAINIVTKNDVVGSPVRTTASGRKLGDTSRDSQIVKLYEAYLNVDVQIYTELCDDDGCDTAKSKAYSILSHITSTIISNQLEIVGRRVLYRGSSVKINSEGDTDLAAVTGTFQIHYIFDQTRPWVAIG